MATEIIVPQLGNEISEAEVTSWEVSVGDEVNEGDALVVITTTKMAMEIEAPASGVLSEIRAEEGELVEIGAILGVIS